MERTNKGKSIIDFPKNYIIIDIETTGLSPEWDSIIDVNECSDCRCHPAAISKIYK